MQNDSEYLWVLGCAEANSYFHSFIWLIVCLLKYIYEKKFSSQFPRGQSGIFRMLLLSSRQSRIQRLFICWHTWQRKAVTFQKLEPANNILTFCLKNDWNEYSIIKTVGWIWRCNWGLLNNSTAEMYRSAWQTKSSATSTDLCDSSWKSPTGAE